MRKACTAVMLVVGVGFGTVAQADGDRRGPAQWRACPDSVTAAADAKFGPGSGAMTECLRVRDDLQIVAAFNGNAVNATNGEAQQVLNVRNIYNDYTRNYGMSNSEDFRIVVVGYAAGARWLLNDTAHMATYGVANPSADIVLDLIDKGVKFYMCQNTMAGQGWIKDSLLPGVDMVPAGVTAVIDFQNRGYSYLNP